MGEVGAAFMQSADPQLNADLMYQWCRANMANYKVPKHFIFVDSLPLNATGKIHKPTLREIWSQSQSSNV